MNNIFNEVVGNGPRPEGKEAAAIIKPDASITAEGILARIDAIIRDNAHIISTIEALQSAPGSYNGHSGQAVGEVVKSRETTNRQILQLLEKMYDDLKPNRDSKAALIKQLDLNHVITTMDSDDVAEFLSELIGNE